MNALEEAVERLGGIEPHISGRILPMKKVEVDAIEKQLGVSFPALYRQLLERFGAAAFSEIVAYRPVEMLGGSSEIGVLAHFYGPVRKDYGKTSSLKWNLDTYAGRMPDSMIPIGTNGMGDQICLGIRGQEAGKIYHWNHENEWDRQEYIDAGEPVPPDLEFQNISLIANSFEDFLNRLRVDEE